MLNQICGTNNKVNSVSEKTKRGKNTTTNAELIVLDENSLLLDTAGFSRFEFSGLNPDEIKNFYEEFDFTDCVYKNCNHIFEKNKCEIIYDLEQGGSKINKNRYERYKEIYLECLEFWRRRYD